METYFGLLNYYNGGMDWFGTEVEASDMLAACPRRYLGAEVTAMTADAIEEAGL